MQKNAVNILMVEDNANVLHLNRTVMERQGFSVLCASSLKQAREIMGSGQSIALAVLDIILPDGDGLEFAREVKQALNCPVLMLSSKRGYSDIVAGLLGATDDYMTKPYRIEELAARIHVLLKKRPEGGAGSITCGAISLDISSGRAFLHGQDMLLSPRETAVLMMLMQNEGRFTSSRELYERAWRLPYSGEAGVLKTTVSRLRKKILSSGYHIESERGMGYRLLPL